jgi:Leucine-rich repeat (LRR) protein
MTCSNICCPLPASGERVRKRGLSGVLKCLSRLTMSIFSAIFWANTMKKVLLVLLTIISFSGCLYSGCDYITGKLPESNPAKPFELTLFHTSDWDSIRNKSAITSLSIKAGGYTYEILDISPLTQFSNLTSLSIFARGGRIRDLSPVSTLTNLIDLKLVLHQRTIFDPPYDIGALAPLNKLKTLTLELGRSTNMAALSALENLESLSYTSESMYDLVSFSSLKSLKSLEVKTAQSLGGVLLGSINALPGLNRMKLDAHITDISPLSNLETLTELDLSDNTISDITALSNKANLVTLNLENNWVYDVSPLSSLNELKFLNLDHNTIIEISPLANLTKLQTLKLSRNLISDISPLSLLKNISTLWLGANRINDISAVFETPKLQELLIDGNPIDPKYNAKLLNLKNDGVKVYYYNLENTDKLLPLLFKDFRIDDRYIVVSQYMYFDNKYYSRIEELALGFKEQGLDLSVMLEALVERNIKAVKIDIPSDKEEGYIIDYPGAAISAGINISESWESDPDCLYGMSFSVPVFDAERNILLVYTATPVCGYINAYRYNSSVLEEIDRIQLWIS